ncbi:MAG TPA: hypothetical protein DCR00_09920, partial [Gammaproteobacteria bacterium]|nr:hypothetical protein [Gammaproteobacteria bacterium]
CWTGAGEQAAIKAAATSRLVVLIQFAELGREYFTGGSPVSSESVKAMFFIGNCPALKKQLKLCVSIEGGILALLLEFATCFFRCQSGTAS